MGPRQSSIHRSCCRNEKSFEPTSTLPIRQHHHRASPDGLRPHRRQIITRNISPSPQDRSDALPRVTLAITTRFGSTRPPGRCAGCGCGQHGPLGRKLATPLSRTRLTRITTIMQSSPTSRVGPSFEMSFLVVIRTKISPGKPVVGATLVASAPTNCHFSFG